MRSSTRLTVRGGAIVRAAAATLLCACVAAAQTTVTWTGAAGDGNYSNPLNWNPNVVPINSMADTFTVIIPANQTVNLDFATPASIEVTDFQIGSGARFVLRPGRTYTVLDDADIGGWIDADGAGTHFSAVGPGAAVTGSAARFTAIGGAQISVAGTTYAYNQTGNTTLMSATNADSRLNLEGIDNIVYGAGGGRWFQTIRAANNGVIDLSGVQNISVTVGQDDVLDIVQETGGVVDLIWLQSINAVGSGNAQVRFFTDTAMLSLPSLQSAAGVVFSPGAGSTVNLPALTSLTSSVVSQAAGSTFDAPNLVDVSNSALVMSTDRTFNSGMLSQIDGALITVQGGLVYDRVADAQLNYNRTGSMDVLSVTDPGSVFDVSSAIVVNYGAGGGRWFQTIRASNSGVMNLSNVASLNVAAGQDDVLDFVAESGAVIDLTRLQAVNAATGSANALVRFFATNGGTINFGDLEVARQTQFSITDVTSTMNVAGSMLLDSGSLSISAGARLTVGEDFTFRYTVETNLAAASAILHMRGVGSHADPQFLEVGGLDTGPGNPANNGNFGFGQLIVGDFGVSTVVQLLDVIDNGNRGAARGDGAGAPEALYLFGLGGPDGLIIRGGSTLIIDNLNVYTTENNVWVHINALFPPGVTVIPYSDGFIELPSPAVVCWWLPLAGAAALRRRRT